MTWERRLGSAYRAGRLRQTRFQIFVRECQEASQRLSYRNLYSRWFPRYGFCQRDLCIDFLEAVEPVSGSGTMLAIPRLTFELKTVSQSESAMPVAPRIGVYRIDILGKVSHRRS